MDILAYLAVREVLKEIRTSLCWNATNCSTIIQCNLIKLGRQSQHSLVLDSSLLQTSFNQMLWLLWTHEQVKSLNSCDRSFGSLKDRKVLQYFTLVRRFSATEFSLPSWNLSWFIALSASLHSSNQGTKTKQRASVKNQVPSIMYASGMCTRKLFTSSMSSWIRKVLQ